MANGGRAMGKLRGFGGRVMGWLRSLGGRIHRGVAAAQPWGILVAAAALVLSVLQFWIDYEDRVAERTVRAWQLVTTPARGCSAPSSPARSFATRT